MDPDRWTQVIRRCQTFGAGEVLVTGGEPFEYEKLLKLLEFFEEHDVRYAIHTNGVHPNTNIFFSWYKNSLRSIPNLYVSTELSEELQRELRGANLPLVFIRTAVALKAKIELNVVLTRQTTTQITDIHTILCEWQKLGITSVKFQPVAFRYNNSMSLDKSSLRFINSLREMKQLKDDLGQFIRNTDQNLQLITSLIKGEELNPSIIAKCNAKSGILFLNPILQEFSCRTLWGNRMQGKTCEDGFDQFCCGFLC